MVRTSGFSGEAGPGSAGHPNMFYVYVLQSMNHDRLYVGMSEDIEQRLKEHNAGKTKSIKAYIPYTLIHSECYQNKTDALKRERQIKNSGKIRQELKQGSYKAPSSNG
jgi:putative endonuclease